MRWTNNKQHYIVAKHDDTADLTPGDVGAALALVVLMLVLVVGVGVL